jgi:hypothetical protein
MPEPAKETPKIQEHIPTATPIMDKTMDHDEDDQEGEEEEGEEEEDEATPKKKKICCRRT